MNEEEKIDNNEKKLNWHNCEFKIGAPTVDVIPPINFNEIAFAGRSNVGKSSLINFITNRNSLSRTSRKPGCTKQLNFFLIDDKMMLVDMPGYGYAKASKTDIAGWNKTIQDYLAGRANLRRVFLLIDSRHGLKKSDEQIMALLDDKAVAYQIVFTKVDKTSRNQLEKIKQLIRSKSGNYPALHPEFISTSSVDKIGFDSLREEVESLI